MESLFWKVWSGNAARYEIDIPNLQEVHLPYSFEAVVTKSVSSGICLTSYENRHSIHFGWFGQSTEVTFDIDAFHKQ